MPSTGKALLVNCPMPLPHKRDDELLNLRPMFERRGFEIEELSGMQISTKDILHRLFESSIAVGDGLLLFLINGHGSRDGLAVPNREGGFEEIHPAELFDIVKHRNGPTFFLIQCCHSGLYTEYANTHPLNNTVIWTSTTSSLQISVGSFFGDVLLELLDNDDRIDLSRPPKPSKTSNEKGLTFMKYSTFGFSSMVLAGIRHYHRWKLGYQMSIATDSTLNIYASEQIVLNPPGTSPPFFIASLEEPIIKYVFMSPEIYERLKNEAEPQKKERAGLVFGRHENDHVVITEVERIPENVMGVEGHEEERPLYQKVIGAGYGGHFNTDSVDQYVGTKQNVVGFYHTHPTRDKLSPEDKREIKNMRNFMYLAKPSALHLLPRMKDLAPGGGWSLRGPAEPLAFVRRGDSVDEISVKVDSTTISRQPQVNSEESLTKTLEQLNGSLKRASVGGSTDDQIRILREMVRVEMLYAELESLTPSAASRLTQYSNRGKMNWSQVAADERAIARTVERLDDGLKKATTDGNKEKQLAILEELARTWRLWGDLKKAQKAAM